MSARIAKEATLSPSSFHKRYRSSYKTSSSSSPTLSVRKRYRGTSKLILDPDSEGDELEEKDTEEDESSDVDDERESGSASEPLGLVYGVTRRYALELTEEIAPSTYEVRQSSRSVSEHKGAERVSAFRQHTLVTWVDPEDGRVYTDILTYTPPAAPVQTPSSPEWSLALWHAIYDIQRENHDLRRQLTEERRERLELTDHVARMERRQEYRGE
nr:hypothetical protein [Tanacetum cinerariifolium]